MRILLADDQPHIRSALRLLFDHEPNLTVVGEAIDASTLCTQISATQPDLLLLDWELPGSSGAELLTILRFLYPHLLIVALSGQLEACEAALSAAGVDSFISKGHPPEQLLSTLRMLHTHCNGKKPFPLLNETLESTGDEAVRILTHQAQYQTNGEQSQARLPLANHTFFKGIDDEQLAVVSEYATEKVFEANRHYIDLTGPPAG